MITCQILLLPFLGRTMENEIPVTVEDRDRIIRTERKLESLKTDMMARFGSVDLQFESVDK